MKSISRQMAEFAAHLQFEDLPPEAVIEAKRFLLDSMGCALAAVRTTKTWQAMYRFTERLGGTSRSHRDRQRTPHQRSQRRADELSVNPRPGL